MLKQLWSFFGARLQITEKGPFYSAWVDTFLKLHDELKTHLLNPNHCFPPPLHFVPRKSFTTVDLRTILQEDPNRIDAYIIAENRRLGEDCFLRLHSSLSFFQQDRYLWLEKRLPWRLHREDIMPWFLATIDRLPKKAQPSNLRLWQERLLRYEPDLSFQKESASKTWRQKPKVILVFGPEKLVGYRGLFHLERQNIDCVQRHNEVITIIGRIKLRFADNKEIVENWKFHLLTEDESAALQIENQLLKGDRIHYGLDCQIIGMIAHEGPHVYSINIPDAIIGKLCFGEKQFLKLVSPPNEKRKSYIIEEKRIVRRPPENLRDRICRTVIRLHPVSA